MYDSGRVPYEAIGGAFCIRKSLQCLQDCWFLFKSFVCPTWRLGFCMWCLVSSKMNCHYRPCNYMTDISVVIHFTGLMVFCHHYLENLILVALVSVFFFLRCSCFLKQQGSSRRLAGKVWNQWFQWKNNSLVTVHNVPVLWIFTCFKFSRKQNKKKSDNWAQNYITSN